VEDGTVNKVTKITHDALGTAAPKNQVLNSWTRKGFKAAVAAAAAGDYSEKVHERKLQKNSKEARRMEDVDVDVLTAGVPNTWAMHVERELVENEASALVGGASPSKLIKAPDSVEFKVRCLVKGLGYRV
jgi:hypothetical protein